MLNFVKKSDRNRIEAFEMWCWGSLQRFPRLPCWVKGNLLQRGREAGEGEMGKGKDGEDGKGGGREGRGLCPSSQNPVKYSLIKKANICLNFNSKLPASFVPKKYSVSHQFNSIQFISVAGSYIPWKNVQCTI